MSFATSSARAVRASTSLLQPMRTSAIRPAAAVTAASRTSQKRLFHGSSTDKAVEVPNAKPTSFQPPPPPPFAQQEHVVPKFEADLNIPEGQLNVIAESYKPSFYEAVAEIMKLRQKYIEDRSIFVESKDMIPLLLGLGANRSDLARMQIVSENLYCDPTLPFRRSRNARFCIDFDSKSLRRLEFQPFTLTADEDFKRYDSGAIRRFDEVQDELQCNSVFQALFAFKAMIIYGIDIAHRPKLMYDTNKWVCTLFNLRTVTTPDILGEPALEGVHSDGVDHTMTTYLGSKNMADGSAATFMHGMGETTGVQLDDIKPQHLLSRVQHKNLLDTLMIVDHERKHSLSPVHPVDKTKEATRDMLIFFTRKPVERNHVSGSIDSLTAHKEMPMEVPIWVPGRQL